MFGTGQGSIHLFRIKGIDVYLNWTWFLVALFEIQARKGRYSSIIWNVIEYLALFAIVLTHEFGHALACRSVGGTADNIMLWPLGGVAYVNPPQRPGATLWSIAAGPLVNVVLAIPLALAFWTARSLDWRASNPDGYRLIVAILFTNIVLLVFNILPIYPLDGGQILRSLLWYPLGRARSLLVASSLGFFGVAGLIALALWTQSIWTGLIAAYAGMNCWNGFKTARALRNLEKIPRRQGFACPSCRTAPAHRTLSGVAISAIPSSTLSRPAASARSVPHDSKKPPASTAVSPTPSPSGRQATFAGVGVMSAGEIPAR